MPKKIKKKSQSIKVNTSKILIVTTTLVLLVLVIIFLRLNKDNNETDLTQPPTSDRKMAEQSSNDAIPTTSQSQSIPKAIPANWTTTVQNLWGPGDSEDEGVYWKLTVSLPPGFTFTSTPSEEFIYSESDPINPWYVHLSNLKGSRREQYRIYKERMGGYINDKPINSCTITSAQEISIGSQQTYLDVDVNCKSPNSDGSIYSYDAGAYLYDTQGMLIIMDKSVNNSQLIEPYLAEIFPQLKLSK